MTRTTQTLRLARTFYAGLAWLEFLRCVCVCVRVCEYCFAFQDVTAMIADIKNPLTQLLQNSLKAERSIKAGREQLKRQKMRLAAAQCKKGAEQASPVVALFDQGVSVARQIKRVSMAKVSEADLDFKAPFVIEAADFVKDVAAAFNSDLDGFKASFDICRKDQKCARASKCLVTEFESDLTFAPKVLEMLKGALVPLEKAGDTLKKAMLLSVFAIDAAYDKVSAEPALVAAVRLTMAGARSVVVTNWLQLLGFCQRKGMQGPFPVARLASFLRSMNPDMLAAYADECGLWTTTLGLGDMLFTPFGAVVGEKVSILTWEFGCQCGSMQVGIPTSSMPSSRIFRISSRARSLPRMMRLKAVWRRSCNS